MQPVHDPLLGGAGGRMQLGAEAGGSAPQGRAVLSHSPLLATLASHTEAHCLHATHPLTCYSILIIFINLSRRYTYQNHNFFSKKRYFEF